MRTVRLLSFLALALCACGTFRRPRDPSKKFALNVAAERFGGDNGINIFVLPVAGSKLVELDVRFAIGAANDPPGKAGLAHLVEHLMFEIKLGKDGETAGDMLTSLAHSYNAFTSYDSTHYVTRVDAKQLDAVVGVYTYMVQTGCAGLDEATFVREREVVRNEIREHHARPEGEIPQLLRDAVYGKGHAYSNGIGGDDTQISSATLADACEFIAKHYTGSRATFLFAGDVTPGRVRELAGKWLAHIEKRPRSPIVRARPVVLERGKPITHELDISEPQLYVMWALPETYSRQGRIAEFAGPELRGVMGWFASTYSFAADVDVHTMGGVHAPVLVLSMSLKDASKIDEALSMVWKSVARLPRELAPTGGSGRYPQHLRANKSEEILAGFELLGERTWAFANYAQFDPGGGYLIGHLKLTGSITSDELRSIGASVFDSKNAVVVLVKPRAGSTGYRAAGLSYSGKLHEGNRGIAVDPDDAQRSLPVPAPSDVRRQTQRYQLDNGLQVVLWPNAELPLVRATLLLNTGRAHEPDSRPGISLIAASETGGDVTHDHTIRTARSISPEADDTTYVGRDFIAPQFGDMDKLRTRIKEILGFGRSAKRREFEKKLGLALYGAAHPYAAKGWLTIEGTNKLDRDSSYSFAKKHYVASNATLVVTGQFDADLIKEHIKWAYSHWSTGTPDAPVDQPAKKRTAAVRVTVDSGASPVTELRVMYAGTNGIDDSYAARTVLASMLSARLRVLREAHGLTYGMDARYVLQRGPGRWVIEGNVDSKRVAEAMPVLLEQIASLRTMDTQFALDFVAARRSRMESLLVAGNDGYSIHRRLLFMAKYDLPDDHYARYGKRLAELRPADIKALVDSELTDAQQVLGLFGPASAIKQVTTQTR